MAQEEVQNGAASVAFKALKVQLTVAKASEAVEFYKAAFSAVETCRTTPPKRKAAADQELPPLISAELQLAGSSFVVSDLTVDDSSLPAKAGGGPALFLETEDVEAAIAMAVAAGAVAEGEITEGEEGACNGTGGGRVGKVKDPYGFVWFISSPASSAAKKACVDVEA